MTSPYGRLWPGYGRNPSRNLRTAGTVPTMATTGRALELLALLCARPQWQAAELCQRLEVPARTLRRDIARLRELGYPITSVTGPHGGYRLGSGGRLPPLVLR